MITKKWLSLSDQLELLQERNMFIDDEQKALNYLERIGYYRLSGYSYSFRQFGVDGQRLDNFVEGTKFSDIIDLFVFDKRLRLLALDALERIELAVRVDIAYLLGHKDPLCHLNSQYFMRSKNKKGDFIYDHWLKGQQDKIKWASKEPYIEHHANKYGGNVPIWVAIEVWDFGTLSTLYSLLKSPDKQIIADKYSAGELSAKHIPLFQQWLRSLNFVRNVSAHHARLWNISVKDRANISSSLLGGLQLDNSRPFYYFCMMKLMLDRICPNSTWKDRFKAHLETFPMDLPTQISLEQMGLVQGWEISNIWLHK